MGQELFEGAMQHAEDRFETGVLRRGHAWSEALMVR